MFGITASHHDFAKATKHMFAIAVEYSVTTCLTEATIPSFNKITVIYSLGSEKVFSHCQTKQAKSVAFLQNHSDRPYSGKSVVIPSMC